MTENQSRFVETEGGRVHYLIEGSEEGRPVVLLHGASFTSQTWKQIGIMAALSQAGYLVYAFDLPGFGQSSSSKANHRTWLREPRVRRVGANGGCARQVPRAVPERPGRPGWSPTQAPHRSRRAR
jgi:pimeloyl-ACP methyl ester carboxylesterase